MSSGTELVAKNFSPLFGTPNGDIMSGLRGGHTRHDGMGGNDKMVAREIDDNALDQNWDQALIDNPDLVVEDNILDGGEGADSMAGGAGDDTYYVDNIGDIIREFAGQGGADKVVATIDYVLDGNVENLDLGSGASKGTGNALANIMQANDNGNELQGGGGNDQLRGGKGNDKLQGGGGDDRVDAGEGNDEIVGGDGAGNDTYVGGVGIDTVRYTSAVTGITVDLTLGTASGIEIGSDTLSEIENIIGGQAGDNLKGNSQANNIDGYTGNDTINGYGGVDTLAGGQGNDSYYVDLSTDVVTETLNEGTDTVYSTATAFTLLANVENGRILSTGTASLTGNGLNNFLYAGAGNNVLNGGGGTDSLSFYYGNNGTGVTVSLVSTTAQATGGSGSDTLSSIENLYGTNFADKFTGDTGANYLRGYDGNDTLDGGTGNDIMVGDDGNDNYYVHDVGDVVSETNAATAGGIDTVYSYLTHTATQTYTLGANVEYGRIVATTASNMTGNSLSNFIYAGKGNNVINGGTGTDSVSFYEGNNGTGVTASLVTGTTTGGSGTDTLISIERLYGTNYADKLTGDTGANYLRGYAGNDSLDGGTGNDSMLGDDGNDIYYVRDVGDVVSETNATTAGGIDTVYSYLTHTATQTYTLGANVENGRIVATTASNMTGNNLSNFLYAGKGNNVINGGTGTDSVSFYEGNNGTGVTASLVTGTATGGSGTDTLISIERLYGTNYADNSLATLGRTTCAVTPVTTSLMAARVSTAWLAMTATTFTTSVMWAMSSARPTQLLLAASTPSTAT
jgi:Ca2+-binding RTX toxin-like protein